MAEADRKMLEECLVSIGVNHGVGSLLMHTLEPFFCNAESGIFPLAQCGEVSGPETARMISAAIGKPVVDVEFVSRTGLIRREDCHGMMSAVLTKAPNQLTGEEKYHNLLWTELETLLQNGKNGLWKDLSGMYHNHISRRFHERFWSSLGSALLRSLRIPLEACLGRHVGIGLGASILVFLILGSAIDEELYPPLADLIELQYKTLPLGFSVKDPLGTYVVLID